jgi:sugar phosphate isomerase/epimerase
MAPADAVHEAASQRLRVGEGDFDIAGFVRALPATCPISVEIPRDDEVAQSSALDRAMLALAGVRAALP